VNENRAIPLTLITPIRPGSQAWLRLIFWLATYLPLPRWTLLRLRLIHFASWTVLRGTRPQLLFESNFNGTVDGYLEAFSYVFPRGMRAIWGSSDGFPGPLPVETLKGWIDDGAHAVAHYYSAYPDASTKEVLASLEVRRRLLEFGARASDLEPARFAEEYGKLIADLQHRV
jgi:hypothetical protein